MSFNFPADLIDASLTCKKLREKLATLPVDDGVTLKDGTPLRRRPSRPAKAYTADEQAEADRWRGERLRAAEVVVTHPFWESVPAQERMRARSALKHHIPRAGTA